MKDLSEYFERNFQFIIPWRVISNYPPNSSLPCSSIKHVLPCPSLQWVFPNPLILTCLWDLIRLTQGSSVSALIEFCRLYPLDSSSTPASAQVATNKNTSRYYKISPGQRIKLTLLRIILCEEFVSRPDLNRSLKLVCMIGFSLLHYGVQAWENHPWFFSLHPECQSKANG